MFLKKIEMQGFKSFADKVVINFDDPITGIVGPNGCGKSNISDAIRWVLGEQSVKSMRGSSMTDVIFNGSEARKKVNLAQVTLVFNNENRALNSDYEELEVTRRLYRDTRESEYLINKVPCRLRDIHDLVLDTGLGRDSLSIISQGSISYFAEAKPIERRVIFEEAAGVSKYKKRKIESINKLERTKENVDRMQDIVDEITRQVSSLKRAAKKAELYKTKKALLESIEVSVICQDIKKLETTLSTNKEELYQFESEIANLETTIGVYDHELQEKRQEIFKMDQDIVRGQEIIMNYVREIAMLEKQKIEADERRKYTLEVGDQKAKAQELYTSMQEANLEFQERKERYDALHAEVEMLTENTYEHNRILADKQQAIASLNVSVNQLRNRLDILTHRLERPFESQSGVQSVMNNKASLFGVLDAVGNVFIAESGYEVAITTALAGSMMHVVTETDKAAVNAINFLKKNMSGRATFIPLTSCRSRMVSVDALTVAEHAEGFLGVAQDFVENDKIYDPLKESLLGNVLVVESIDHANRLSKLLKFGYKIVTLDGDVIHKGGTMSGGKSKTNQQSMLTLKRDKENLEYELQQKQDLLIRDENEMRSFQVRIKETNDTLMQRRIALAQLEPLLDVKRAKYERIKQAYEDINPNSEEMQETLGDDVVSRLNKAYMQRDELSSNLSLLRERRLALGNEVQRKEVLIREHRSQLNSITQKKHALNVQETKAQTRMETNLERLSSEYQMTFEFALENVYDASAATGREEVLILRQEISGLGNVNLEAPEEYEETRVRHEFLTKQLEDLVEARDKLLNVIEEMDKIMVVQFKEMFDKINGELNSVFGALFGGGKAQLVLEDEDDLLNTGIDIDVQPPGKSVQNIRLFSGGEKSLIAISVLFSILKARHVPLCIFDEVEAALDQANVERLAHYISNFSDDTQFIVITHRSGTMAQCDVLYGVTMPSKGVSSMLRVKLDEAVELKEDA